MKNKETKQVTEMYRTRDLAEQQATSARPVLNRLGAASLSSLLDDRKFVTSRSDLEHLSARYTVDVPVLENLARFVNSPSIGEGTVVRTVGEDGQEKITMQVRMLIRLVPADSLWQHVQAVWTEPVLKDNTKVIQS
jgi:hypothetical protein